MNWKSRSSIAVMTATVLTGAGAAAVANAVTTAEPTPTTVSTPAPTPTPTSTTATETAALEQTVADRARVLRRFVSSVMSGGFPVEQDAVVFDTATLEMTEAETVELIGKVQDLINQYTERAKAATVAGDRDGRRRTRVYFDVLPLPEDAAGEGVGAAGTETGG